jgi:hypothetical protein
MLLYEVLVYLLDGAVVAGIFFTWEYVGRLMLEDKLIPEIEERGFEDKIVPGKRFTVPVVLSLVCEVIIIGVVLSHGLQYGLEIPYIETLTGKVENVTWWYPWTLVHVEAGDIWTLRGDYRANFSVGGSYRVVLTHIGSSEFLRGVEVYHGPSRVGTRSLGAG